MKGTSFLKFENCSCTYLLSNFILTLQNIDVNARKIKYRLNIAILWYSLLVILHAENSDEAFLKRKRWHQIKLSSGIVGFRV